MRHVIWNYKGYDDLDLEIDDCYLQNDWNCTILSSMNSAFGDDFENGMTLFASEKLIDGILKSIIAYDEKTNSLFNKKIIQLDIDTPKIYVTRPEVCEFSMIEHNNYGSVTVKNY